MTILQPTFLGKHNSTPIFSSYILFLDFFCFGFGGLVLGSKRGLDSTRCGDNDGDKGSKTRKL
jgi:hypothetical protein